MLMTAIASVICLKAEATDGVAAKKVLVVVGYMDEDNFEARLNHPSQVKYLPSISEKVESNIRNFLNMVTVEKSKNFFESKKGFKNVQITLLNPHYTCEGENGAQSFLRGTVCFGQTEKIKNTMSYLNQNINLFDQVIYIGHSRKGLGLAIGPFQTESTFDLNHNFYNSVEAGQLKKIVMASCESNTLYRPLTRLFELVGTNEKLYIFPDLMSLTLTEIRKLFF